MADGRGCGLCRLQLHQPHDGRRRQRQRWRGTNGNTSGGTPGSADIAVIVGNNFMKSAHNGTVNPAVDTVAVGGSVTWTWTNTGSVPHGIESLSSPSFPTGPVLSGNGQTYRVTFNTAGSYQYDCVAHGAEMPGTIVVQ